MTPTEVFNSSYPARGRKLATYQPSSDRVRAFNSSYPARGRKLLRHLEIAIRQSSIPLTPQGDGNVRLMRTTDPILAVQFLLPRKGTETISVGANGGELLYSSIPLTPQGDGNHAEQ